jgi:uncharacterized membrane protein YfhO
MRSGTNLRKFGPGNYQFQLAVPQDCSAKLDSVEIVSAVSEVLGTGEAKILSYKPHEIKISTSFKKASFVLLSEVSYPGWIAKMDNAYVPIHRVNYALRAVAVGPGDHTIEFQFWPRSIYIGLAVSLISLAGVLTYLWFQRKHLISQ